jgi:excisionase family DNA binding protein
VLARINFFDGGVRMSAKLLRVPKVAEIIDVTIPRTYELLRQGIIPGVVRMGRQIRVDPDALAAWIASGGSVQTQVEDTPARKLPKIDKRKHN